MGDGPPCVLSTLLAVCEGTGVGDQIAGIAIALVVLGAWVGAIWQLVGRERDSDERKALLALVVASALVGGMVISTVHLALEQLILLSLVGAIAIGVVAVLLSRRIGIVRGILTAAMGSLSLPVGAVFLLILHVSLGSGCLGDELG
jgi:hypothetical protein